jgi:GH24 family phage-related lysozyme (muramidase)
MVWTQEQADARFVKSLKIREDAVTKAIGTAPTTQNQFDAMVALAYNIGMSAFAGSSVLRFHKLGKYESAADSFKLWNKAKGVILNGLTKRRAAEAALYLSK